MSEARKARCMDPDWVYIPHKDHDLRKSMARYKRIAKEAEAAKQAEAASKQAARTASKPPRVKERT